MGLFEALLGILVATWLWQLYDDWQRQRRRASEQHAFDQAAAYCTETRTKQDRHADVFVPLPTYSQLKARANRRS